MLLIELVHASKYEEPPTAHKPRQPCAQVVWAGGCWLRLLVVGFGFLVVVLFW